MNDPISPSAPEVAAFRRFNRFYTAFIGALGPDHQGSHVSLTEMRVLYEIGHRAGTTARGISADMGVDPGYVSRLLKGFRAKGWVEAKTDPSDGRARMLSLTEAGWAAFAPMQERSREIVADALSKVAPGDRARLMAAMETIKDLLAPTPTPAEPYILRPQRPGDLGAVVSAHGRLYAAEYNFDMSFEALVARIAADFTEQFDPARHCCWIAERQGEVVGSVFVVDQDEETAKLRMLFVDPKARGLGIGKRLTEEAIRFARAAGYRRMTLWTNDILTAAREIYRAAGFVMTKSEPLNDFGVSMMAETWDLEL